jgi:hypothetical protein
VAGAALVAGGIALLSHYHGEPDGSDPITEAQRMLDRAQTKISEIEAGLQSSRDFSPQAI